MIAPKDTAENAVDVLTLFVSIEGEPAALTIECGALDTVAQVIELVSRTQGRADLPAFSASVQDADEQTAHTVAMREALRGQRRGHLHLHRCHRVTVALDYNATTLTHRFSPSSTVHRVLRWAVGRQGFNVEADAHDLVLQVAGTTMPLAPNVHVGTLLRDRHCELSLELVPKDRPQG